MHLLPSFWNRGYFGASWKDMVAFFACSTCPMIIFRSPLGCGMREWCMVLQWQSILNWLGIWTCKSTAHVYNCTDRENHAWNSWYSMTPSTCIWPIPQQIATTIYQKENWRWIHEQQGNAYELKWSMYQKIWSMQKQCSQWITWTPILCVLPCHKLFISSAWLDKVFTYHPCESPAYWVMWQNLDDHGTKSQV